MIEDITVSYCGVSVKVTHSLYKPYPNVPGKIRYTFHLPTRQVVLSHKTNEGGEEYWYEIPDDRTLLAAELGKIYEDFYKA